MQLQSGLCFSQKALQIVLTSVTLISFTPLSTAVVTTGQCFRAANAGAQAELQSGTTQLCQGRARSACHSSSSAILRDLLPALWQLYKLCSNVMARECGWQRKGTHPF